MTAQTSHHVLPEPPRWQHDRVLNPLLKGKVMNKFSTLVAAALIATAPVASWAADDHAKKDSQAMPAEMTDGEVRNVDSDAAKVTLKHADIKSLDMPAMTMVFNVKDKAMLADVKTGDKVKFKAVNDAGKITITEMQVVR
jgi:Cu(I)/Ag(I) efflux system protein CusF